MAGKAGLVLEGGAFRGVFTSGVIDVLLENGIEFDYVVGVSAGAGNGMGYLSHQEGRSRECIKPHDKKYNYYGISQISRSGQLLNLDRMFYDFPLKEIPYDFEALKNNPTKLELVVSNCETGKAEYHTGRCSKRRYLAFGKASCSIPLLCEPVCVDGQYYLDGSICDSIPIQRALDQGCDRLVVVMTKSVREMPTDYGKGSLGKLMKLRYGKQYPEFYKALCNRTRMYAGQVKLMQQLEAEGKLIVIRPTIAGIGKFEQDDDKIELFYRNGRREAKKHIKEIRRYSKYGAGYVSI